ncbi:hypothetical protein CC78DRAFT_139288 [Lojkania enalia]|uniref:Uncharacterized protein n=1 Tax=Lojkania enalia TaxID=147567 RepID=A0A9P4TRJ9_9PLEO|nr:hypothetical protein CC78DRAFT_139288 [Didymosphaeria enalia]
MPPPNTPSTDDALLARLNALKKSSVSFDTTPSASITPSKPSALDDLAARFARLGSASPSASPNSRKPPGTKGILTGTDEGAPPIAPGASSYLEAVLGGIGGGDSKNNVEDEKSLEELLRELGGKEEWDVSTKEQDDVGRLLKDVRSILPEVQRSVAGRKEDPPETMGERDKEKEELTDWENVEFDVGVGKVGRETQKGEENGDDEQVKKSEDEEADDVIARVTAELEISKKYDSSEALSSGKDSDNREQKDALVKDHTSDPIIKSSAPETESNSPFSLPSAPSTLPAIPQDDLDKTQALEDALTARLAALYKPSPSNSSLNLPSAPSFAPSQKPAVKSNLPTYTDEEIDSWCIICNDDARLKCLGCDGDLYCQNCWMEGHKGESASYEERRHKAILYNRKKGLEKQAAAAG